MHHSKYTTTLATASVLIALVLLGATDLFAQGRSRSRNFTPQAGQPGQPQPGQPSSRQPQSGQPSSRQPQSGQPQFGRGGPIPDGGSEQSRSSRRSRRGRGDSESAAREASAAANREKVITQLKALDSNNNGRLEPTESNPLSIAVFNKVGLDTTKSIGLSALTSTVVAADLSGLQIDNNAKVGGKLEKGVPGFSDPKPGVLPGSFEISKHPALLDKRALEERYTKEVIAQAKSVMKTYDRNDNLMLDPNEIVLIPWGAPAPAESDLDKNGYLTEIEMCERLAKRSNGYLVVNKENPAATNESPRSNRFSRPPVEEVKKKARPTMSADDRTAKYVRELIAKYDENRDDMLDKQEVEKMRAKPMASIDKDKDEAFSYEELYTHYSGGKKATKKVSTDTSDLPGNVFWESPLGKNSSGSQSSSRSSSRSSRDRGSSSRSTSSRGGSSRGGSSSKGTPDKNSSKIPAIKFGK